MIFSNLKGSPSRTYAIMVKGAFTPEGEAEMKKFKLPNEYENECSEATWYFYNKLDGISAGTEAFPAEILENIKDVSKK